MDMSYQLRTKNHLRAVIELLFSAGVQIGTLEELPQKLDTAEDIMLAIQKP